MNTTKKWMTGLMIGGASLTLAACSTASAEPFEIKWGKTECEVCKMKVTDRQFAAEAVMENGKGYAFDDIGCLMRDWYPKQKEDQIAAMYVKDYKTKAWVELEDGHYVYDEMAKTPMAYNIVSFGKTADAKSYMKDHGGKLMDLDDLKKHDWKRGKMEMKMDGEDSEMKMDDSSSDEGHSH